MNRALTWINLLGVLALAALCVLQWRANRDLNLQVNSLESTRLALSARLGEQAARLRGLAADLERFRDQLAATTLSLKDAETKLRSSEHLAVQLARERDQLKESTAQWSSAVALRDDRLRVANASIHDLDTRLNDTASKYNALVSSHNALVQQLNDATAAGAQQSAPPAANPNP